MFENIQISGCCFCDKKTKVRLFYDGCIIIEVRDYRRRNAAFATVSSKTTQTVEEVWSKLYDRHFVLARPSMQTLLADLNSICNEGSYVWTQEDKYALESQLLLATQQPLCLDPSIKVSIVKARLNGQFTSPLVGHRRLKRLAQRNSNASVLRAARWNEFNLPHPFHILKIRHKMATTHDSMYSIAHLPPTLGDKNCADSQLKEKSTSSTRDIFKFGNFFRSSAVDLNYVDHWSVSSNKCKMSNPPLTAAADKPVARMLPRDDMILVKKFTKTFEKPKYTLEPMLNAVEEIVLEALDKSSKNNYSKLLIKRRTSDGLYFCHLFLAPPKPSTPRQPTSKSNTGLVGESDGDVESGVLFKIGLAYQAEKYIQQYVNIFTEEGRRAVTVKHKLLNDNESCEP